VDEIIKNRVLKAGEGKTLTKAQLQELLQASICYYIDKISFNGKDRKQFREVKNTIEKLRKEKILIKDMYDYLGLPELIAYEPSLNGEELKRLFGDK